MPREGKVEALRQAEGHSNIMTSENITYTMFAKYFLTTSGARTHTMGLYYL